MKQISFVLATLALAAASAAQADTLAKFKASGRLNARERIAALLDADSFRELGSLAGKGHYSREGTFERLDPTNAITGTGLPSPRPRPAAWASLSLVSLSQPARHTPRTNTTRSPVRKNRVIRIGSSSCRTSITIGLSHFPAFPLPAPRSPPLR